MDHLMISKVEIYPAKNHSKGLICFASLVFIGIKLNNIAVYQRNIGHGCRLVFPDKVLPNGSSLKSYHPVDKKIGSALEEAITEKVREMGLLSLRNWPNPTPQQRKGLNRLGNALKHSMSDEFHKLGQMMLTAEVGCESTPGGGGVLPGD